MKAPTDSHRLLKPYQGTHDFVALATTVVLLLASTYCRAASFDVVIIKDVMVPMRDGVHLATDICLPAAEGKALPGPFSAIVIRGPYGKSPAEKWARWGYASVVQDVRGRGQSEGDFYIYVNEGEDGYDCVEWVSQQSWCNGKVGTVGQSYLAATQNALAIHRPPHLQAMFVMVGTSNYIEDGAGRGGAFALLHNVAYGFGLASSGKEAQADDQVAAALRQASSQLDQWLWAAPLKKNSPLQWAPSYQKWYSDWRDHPTYDDYWKQVGYNFEEHHHRYPNVPIYFVGAWYDLFKRGTLKSYEGLSGRNAPTKLLMGPWTHSVGKTFAGDVDFGKEAAMSLDEEAKRWFDQILQGQDTGILDEPSVKYFNMGAETPSREDSGRMQSGGRWQTSPHWPPAGFLDQKIYLQAGGALTRTIPKVAAHSRFLYDPDHPVPSIGGNIDSGMGVIPRGARNQTPPPNGFAADNQLPLSSRADVLSFQTVALRDDIEVTGWVRAVLWVSSQAKDTDFTAKLIDVYPPSTDYPEGYAMNLEDGILRMRFRNSRQREELMDPGTIYPITIDLWAISNTFRQGHKIRLDISSSSFPMYDRNPNTGEPLGRHTHMISTLNTVYHEPEHPSHLLLPIRRQ